ncbi:hypothetical protein A6E05_16360 [Aliivibrio sp. 1S165]|uniref:hypothetical protein n=1 Tax=unclassified Aliivibrio TaxID=2645654 RepID=UPI00080E11DD|nr:MULTISPECIES: hypothetical protein [unclassified Aliivibrio]OCH16456.1 hypothetical protein A6E05_16360 [Aliivibrio sp. 1S165]OCH33893.1 hypothetical protein A6E06_16990 [Aliivibrio sp. 1S175]
MTDFFIQVRNNKVMTSRIINGDLDVIRFFGEEWIAVDLYWQRFKEKIEHSESDTLALLMISDDESFMVDPDIVISDTFENSLSDLKGIIDTSELSNAQVLLYPEIFGELKATLKASNQVKDANNQKQDSVQKETIALETMNSGSLQSYYRKATREFKRGAQ